MMFTLVPTAMAEGETAVAKVGDVEYETLQAAINAATTENSTVTLLKDVTEDITIPTGVTAMLDLSGKTLTNKAGKHTITVENGGKLNISDSVGTGVVDNTSHGKAAIYNKGEVTLNGGTFTRSQENGSSKTENGGNSFYTLLNHGAMTIKERATVNQGADGKGKFSSLVENGYYSYDIAENDGSDAPTLIVSGGTLYGGLNTIKNDEGGVLEITGGEIKNSAQACVLNWNKASITAGTFTLSSGEATVMVGKYSDQAVGDTKISGGTFTAPNDIPMIARMSVNGTDYGVGTSTSITGGTFSGDVAAYIPSDYIQGTDGTVAQLGETNAVAKVDDTYYKTLAEAVAAANNATVTLLKDVTANVTIPADKTITLNLNGNDITVNDGCAIVNKGTLTVTGSGNVTTSANGSAAVANFPNAIATLNGGTYSSSNWYVIKNLGTMTIDGHVTVKKPDGSTDTSSLIDNGWVSNEDTVAGETVAAQADKAKLTIKNGAFEGKSGSASCSVVKNDDYGVLEITGGTFDSTNNVGTSNATTILNWNVATISGGTFKGSYPISNGSYANTADQGKLTITGGNFSGTSSLFGQAQGGTSGAGKVTITDGSFKAPQFGAFDYAVEISGGSFSQSVERKYLDRSLNAELKRASGETPYSYYTSMNDALAAAKPGDTVTDLNATTGSKVTLTLKYNDGATADTTYNVASGTTITLPTPAHRSGYTFNGWYDGSKFYAAGASYKVSATATLNASWSYISSGSSSYDPTYSVSTPSKTEHGTVTVSPKSASKGDTVTVTVKPDSGYVLETLTVTDKNGNELTLKDKGDGKYTFTMPAGKVEVKATFMEDNSMLNFFYDVPNGAYFYEAVKWAVKNGITTGVGNDLFAPEQPCTRAQIVTFLWRAAGSPEPKTASSFTDVPANAYYAKAVAWAVENGITNGMTATMFAPDATCTRGQSVTFLHRALKGTASGSTNFTDVKSDAFYADAINWAVANNVTNGTSNTTFSPNADCTRAEIVTFLYRAYQGK